MNNEMILNSREQKVNGIFKATVTTVNNLIAGIASYYGSVLERDIDNKQTLALINAQLAFVMTVFPIEASLLLRLLCALWLVAALLKCKEVL